MASPKTTNTLLPTPDEITAFQQTVWEYYEAHGRHDLPWRRPASDGGFDSYAIVVSELMLQQTQVGRVIPKFQAFLEQFPTWTALANVSLAEVLTAWSGLGYNRRAKFLWQTAGVVRDQYNGQLPDTVNDLVALPGIGANTAGAIMAYAFNKPVVFIETNIRTVFIHHFYADQAKVPDKAIAALVQATLPNHGLGRAVSVLAKTEGEFISPDTMRNPAGVSHYRAWYWALMDYGTYLKQTVGNVSRVSAHYSKQSAFQGSRRQIRGQVLKYLTSQPYSLTDLSVLIPDGRLPAVLDDLVQEGFICCQGGSYRLQA